jgi:hypothetical protein
MTHDKVDVIAAPLDTVIEVLRGDVKTMVGVAYRPPGGVATQILQSETLSEEDVLERIAELAEAYVKEVGMAG